MGAIWAPFGLPNRLKWCAANLGRRSLKPPARQRRPRVPPDPQSGSPRPLQEPKMDPKGHPKTTKTHHSATPGLQNDDQGSKNSSLNRLNGRGLVGSRAGVKKRREPSPGRFRKKHKSIPNIYKNGIKMPRRNMPFQQCLDDCWMVLESHSD